MPQRLTEDAFNPSDSTPEDSDLLPPSGDTILEALLLPEEDKEERTFGIVPSRNLVPMATEAVASNLDPLPPNETPSWATNDCQTAIFLKAKLHHTIINDNEYQAKGEHGSILWRTDPGRGLRVYVNGYASNNLTQKDVFHLATGLRIGMNR